MRRLGVAAAVVDGLLVLDDTLAVVRVLLGSEEL